MLKVIFLHFRNRNIEYSTLELPSLMHTSEKLTLNSINVDEKMHQLKELLYSDERKQAERKNYNRSSELKHNVRRFQSAQSVAYVNEQLIYEN